MACTEVVEFYEEFLQKLSEILNDQDEKEAFLLAIARKNLKTIRFYNY